MHAGPLVLGRRACRAPVEETQNLRQSVRCGSRMALLAKPAGANALLSANGADSASLRCFLARRTLAKLRRRRHRAWRQSEVLSAGSGLQKRDGINMERGAPWPLSRRRSRQKSARSAVHGTCGQEGFEPQNAKEKEGELRQRSRRRSCQAARSGVHAKNARRNV